MTKYFAPLLALFIFSCTPDKHNVEPTAEKSQTSEASIEYWLFTITLSDSVELPVKVTSRVSADLNFTIHNAEEKIQLQNIRLKGDSIFMEMPVFQTGFEGVFKGETMSGVLVKYDAENYRLPFKAKKVTSTKPQLKAPSYDLNKRYKVLFRPGQENETHAVGEFKQNGNSVSGTFMTETGDYRFLSGTLEGDKLRLSAFDGIHLYVFKATVNADSSLNGMFFSGKTRADKWIGEANNNFQLADPETLTYLKEGESELSFSFNTTQGETIEYSKEKYLGKVVILQILGSWCPNCMDESKFLQAQYLKHNSDGLEIIGLSFERKSDKEISYKAMNKMTKDLNLTYPIVFAGSTRIADREKALPQLNKIMSFPTSIYINKKGEVVKIHTGFSGPGTSQYETFVDETEALIKTLLAE